MIEGRAYTIHLAFEEVVETDRHLKLKNKTLKDITEKCSFSADYNGITIYCPTERAAGQIWCAVLEATE